MSGLVVQVTKEEFHQRLLRAAETSPRLYSQFRAAVATKLSGATEEAQVVADGDASEHSDQVFAEAVDGDSGTEQQDAATQIQAVQRGNAARADAQRRSARRGSFASACSGTSSFDELPASATSTDADNSSNEEVDGNADSAEVACEVVVEADAVELIEEPVSRAESDAFFELYDTDGSGAVEMEELLEMVASFKQVDSGTLNQAKIKQVWDADGDGTVRCVGVLCELVE